MKVRMLVGISGGRGDGTAWPGQGGELEVDADEGASLCAGGLAVPVAEPGGPVETPEAGLPGVEARGAESPAEAPAVPRPPANAPKAAWVAYAAAQGMSEGEAAGMSKADLIAALG